MHILHEQNSFNNKDSGVGKNNIYFSESYHNIAGKENYQNIELNKVLAESIYENIKNNFDYIKQTQYNTNNNNIYKKYNLIDILDKIQLNGNNYQKELANKDNSLDNTEITNFDDKKLNPHIKSHNILKNDENSIEICHHIPYLNSKESIEFKNNSIKQAKHLNKKEAKMCDPRYKEYPPMNGFGFIHGNTSNGNGFVANTYNKELANLTMNQHNMHGRNNLMFEDGNIPYGLYDQSNFTGTNSVMCGGIPPNEAKMMYRKNGMNEPFYNNYPMGNGMGYNYAFDPPHIPNMNRNMMNGGYLHEARYCNNPQNVMPKYSSSNVNNKDHKKEICRKNVSKVKKGDIDINIETSSNRKGVTIDLNIGVKD